MSITEISTRGENCIFLMKNVLKKKLKNTQEGQNSMVGNRPVAFLFSSSLMLW
jgi:hypothetical protein